MGVLHILMAFITFLILFVSVSAESIIRIPAYQPRPPSVIPGRMLARRVGEGPSVIQDPPNNGRPQFPSRRPFRPSQPLVPRRAHRRPQRRTGDNSEETDMEERLRSSLASLSSDALRNPHETVRPPGGPISPAGTSAGSSELPFGAVLPPSIRPPSVPPPFPAFGPPSPPPTVGPPTSPPEFMAPAPPSSSNSQVTGIKCIEFDGREMFQALLSLPDGYETVPVLEDRPTIDLTTNPFCRIIPTSSSVTFNLILSKYEACGVRKCRQSSGETWNCLILRFPLINGIKLPEDELVEIRCRPHDATADHNPILSVATAKYADKNQILSDREPTVFEGAQEFKCEIGLFRQLPGTQEFTSRIEGDAALELGEKVQLWSIVKGGDGWLYSRLTEVVILKEDEDEGRSLLNTIVLVYSDGCRNVNYKVIAENHPFRDRRNSLINKFTFRVFMFQDMEPGDSLLVSAKVIGCVREEDCAPTVCGDDGREGYGRRRREVKEKEFVFTTKYTIPTTRPPYPTGPTRPVPAANSYVHRPSQFAESDLNTTNWSRNLAIRVRMPGQQLKQKSVQFGDCKLYLYISLGIAVLFCIVSSTCAAFTAIRYKRKVPPSKTPASTVDLKPASSCDTEKMKCHKNKKPLQVQTSSSGSESLYTTSSESTNYSQYLRELPVPPTVKHRKKKVNAELINLFNSDDMIPYNAPYPPMLNYYGYMVVPRPPPSNQKISVRSLKRGGRSKLPRSMYDEDHCRIMHQSKGKREVSEEDRCSSSSPSRRSTDNVSSHTSVIQITSSGSDTISHRSVGVKPRPRPRSSLPENIYNEIRQNTSPTMV